MKTPNLNSGCDGYRRLQGLGLDGLRDPTLSRRSLVRGIAGGIGGLGLTQLGEKLALASHSKSEQPKSLIVLWLQGGPSQLETFDPHPGTRTGGDTKSIDTSIKGYQIADTLPATAEQMHHTTLVRSIISKEGDHERATYHLKTGWRPDPTVVHPSIGSIACYKSEQNIEIPRHISIGAGQWPPRGGYLGPSLDAFQMGDPAKPVPNLTTRVDQQRMDTRLDSLLGELETEFQRGRLADLNDSRTLHQTATQRATKMMSSEQIKAFDVLQESATTQKLFGETPFGRGCLAAVRLVETGVRCVEVELGGWDSHINNHDLQVGRCEILDKALAGLLSELAERDLLENTIVYCGGEFGRTPVINPAAGRDHWPHGFSAVLAGGPFRKGYVHGETAANPDPKKLRGQQAADFDPKTLVKDAVTVQELHATLLKALDIDYSEVQMTPIGRPLRWSDAEAVPQLLKS